MSDPTTREAEQYWGKLFDSAANPSEQLQSLLTGIANYISVNVFPKEVRPLIPEKVNSYYREVGGNYDPLFKDTPSAALSQIYATLGCRHTLQQGDNNYAIPDKPALEATGFVRWQVIQILLDPAENVPYLQTAVRKFEIIDPTTGQRFPTVIPASAFPDKPDTGTSRWHDQVTSKLAQRAAAEAKPTEPIIRLAPPEPRPVAPDSRRSSRSPSATRRDRVSPQRSRDRSPNSVPSVRLSHGHTYDPRFAIPTESKSRSSEVSPRRSHRDSRVSEASSRRHSRSPEPHSRRDKRREFHRDPRRQSTAEPESRRRKSRRSGRRSPSETSTSSSSESLSSTDSAAAQAPSSMEPSPVAKRHAQRRSYDDDLYRRRHLSPSRAQPPLSSSRSRSPNANRNSYSSSSSARVIPVIPLPTPERPVSDPFLTLPPELARRGSGNIPTYVPAPPPPVGGRIDPAYMELQPWGRQQAQGLLDRKGGPPRGNYRGANVRFGTDEVLPYGGEPRRRRMSVDERDIRPPIAYRPGGGGREVRGVDGRRYVALD
ncbi:MAG: hypothetical protein M1814_004150 [Vezdaea aestivalis]|nr:MAG: hypothetical protein M1814_004150 [Vezdaea aestivalis]